MALLVRKIRKSKWQGSSELSWLPNNALQADALGGLQTKANILSVYEVENEPSAIERALTALAASGDVISNLDYVTMDLEITTSIEKKLGSNGSS